MANPEQVFLKQLDNYMNDFTDRIFQLSQENLANDNKIDTGNLLKSGNVHRGFLNKEIVYTAPYSDTIEFGRLPGTMPPVNALINWVKRKLGVTNQKQAISTAWAIATAIKQRGLEPSPFMQPAIDQAKVEFKLEEA